MNAPLGDIPAAREHNARTRTGLTNVSPLQNAQLDKNSVLMAAVNVSGIESLSTDGFEPTNCNWKSNLLAFTT